VPGIRIPEKILNRFDKNMEKEQAENLGVEISIELANKMNIKHSTAVRLIKRMEREMFIEKIRLLDDKRVTHLKLTDKGKKVRELAMPLCEELSDALKEDIDEKDIATYKKVLTKFVTNIIEYDEENINAVEFGKALEEAGADAIAIHGRTKKQMYEGKADWDIITEIKENISIPVIGNGDVFTIQDSINMLDKTNCDAIMIGRGAKRIST